MERVKHTNWCWGGFTIHFNQTQLNLDEPMLCDKFVGMYWVFSKHRTTKFLTVVQEKNILSMFSFAT